MRTQHGVHEHPQSPLRLFPVIVSVPVSGSKLTQDEDGDSIKDGAYVGQQPHDHSQLREKQRATQRAQDQQ